MQYFIRNPAIRIRLKVADLSLGSAILSAAAFTSFPSLPWQLSTLSICTYLKVKKILISHMLTYKTHAHAHTHNSSTNNAKKLVFLLPQSNKINLSRYRPGQALREPGVWDSEYTYTSNQHVKVAR